MNAVLVMLVAFLLTAACTSFDSVQQPTAANGPVESSAGLRFATPTPDPMGQYSDVKAELEAKGMLSILGKSKDQAFYALVVKCGGPSELEVGLIKGVIPNEDLVYVSDTGQWYVERETGVSNPLRVQLIWSWEHTIEWQVLEWAEFGGVWRVVRSGSMTNDCEVLAV